MEQQIKSGGAMLRFTVGGRRLQIPVAEVERVLSLQRQTIRPLPFGLGRPRILGLFSFRGAALPLVGAPGAPCGGTGEVTALLLGSGAERFGLAVDNVSSISEDDDPDFISVCARALYEGSGEDA